MKTREIIEVARGLAKPFRISKGKDFCLKDVDPNDTLEFTTEGDKPRAKEALANGVLALAELQDKLYAQDKWALLLIFQAMDAAGKCQVYSFKSPSADDLDHDYLWRCMKVLPNRGHIGIFNRSYYEEVLVVRVHPEFLSRQRVPPELVGKRIWDERFEDIRNFEQYLTRNGVVVRKFFLHVSKKEQKRRFLERIDDQQKNWKFSSNDANERDFWDDYMKAYEEMIQQTATKDAPWYVVPADNKWFTRVVVAAAVIEALADLDLAYPKVDEGKVKELAAAKNKLLKK